MQSNKQHHYKYFLWTFPVLWIGLLIYGRFHINLDLQFGESYVTSTYVKLGLIISCFLGFMTMTYYWLRKLRPPLRMIQIHTFLTIGGIVFFLIYKYIWMDCPKLLTAEDIKNSYELYLQNKQKYQRWESLYFIFLFTSIMSFAVNIVFAFVQYFRKTSTFW